MDVSAFAKPQSPPATFLDRLGGRFVVRDRTGAPVEILVFSNELVAAPGFEAALKDSVGRLADFRHPSARRVRGLARLADPDNRLALVSDLAAGTRLSELLYAAEQDHRPIETRVAVYVVRELLAVTAALHQAAQGVAHGAIGPERILITPEGQVLLAEYALGAALECHAALPSERLWKDYRLAVPDEESPRFSQGTDVVQIGVVALSLLLGRLLRRDEFPRRVSELLLSVGEIDASGSRSPLGLGLRAWLLRALQISPQDFFTTVDEARTRFEYLLSTESSYAADASFALMLLRVADPLLAPQVCPGPAESTQAEPRLPESGAGREIGATPEKPTADTLPAVERQPEISEGPQKPPATTSSQEAGRSSATPPAAPFPAHPPPIPAAAGATAEQPAGPAVPPAMAGSLPEAAPTAGPMLSGMPTAWIVASALTEEPLLTAAQPVPASPPPTAAQRETSQDVPASRPAPATSPLFGPRSMAAGTSPSDQAARPPVSETTDRPLSAEDLELPPGVACVAQDVHSASAGDSESPITAAAHAPAARSHVTHSITGINPSHAHPGERALFGGSEAGWVASLPWLTRRWLMVGAGAFGLIVVAIVLGVRLLSGAAPARSATGTLRVDSRPPGAEVLVDGKPRGRTPLAVDLAVGAHRLEVGSRSNPKVIPITIAAGARLQQYVELPEAPQRGELRVVSEPPGARVVVDGTPRGEAPITVTDLAPGEHSVALEGKTGTVKQTVTITAGATASLVVPLDGAAAVPATPQGWIAVSAPVPMQLFENGRLLGTSQGDAIEVPVGRHEIELVNTTVGYREKRSIEVAAGKMAPVPIEMPSATLSLNAIPWAEVWVDGRKIGDTPLGTLTLPAGPHEVVFRHPEFGEQRQTVIVKLPGPTLLSVDLRK